MALRATLSPLRRLLLAHRLSTACNATRILVLDEGRVMEQGSPTDLMARDGLYALLVRRQFVPPSALISEMQDDEATPLAAASSNC